MNKEMSNVLKVSAILLGIIFYIYYGIYKMIFVHFDLVGGDFMHGYFAAKNFIDGRPLHIMPAQWTPYFYSPIASLIFVPFTFLSPKTAIFFWLIITHLIILISIYATYKFYSKENKINSATATIIAFCFSFPLYGNILTGNINILVFFCINLIYYLVLSQKKSLIPSLIAIATFIKIYPALFLVEYLRKRKWEAIKYFLLTFLFIGIIALGIFGIEAHAYFIQKSSDIVHYVGIFSCSSFVYFIKLFLPTCSSIALTIINMLFCMFLLTLWWIRSVKNAGIKPQDNCQNTLVSFFILTTIIIMTLPSSWLFYHALYIIPFYFVIVSRFSNLTVYRMFSVFIIIFCLINFWEPIVYHLPVSLDGLTIKVIGDNKNSHPILYPLFYSIPFTLNLLFFSWLLFNYDNIVKIFNDK